MPARVWLVNQVREDMTPAEEFGEITLVNHRYIYTDEINDHEIPNAFLTNMRRAASRFNPKDDYVVLIGDHLQLVTFTSLLMAHHGHYHVLRWDRLIKGYIIVRIDYRGENHA